MRFRARLYLIFSLGISLSRGSLGSTLTSSCDLASVQSAVASAVDGDTILIQPGTCVWTSGVNVTQAITLAGSGIGSTIIKDAIPDATNSALFSINLVKDKVTRLTGIDFQDGPGGGYHYWGVVGVGGINTDNRRVRIDNCKFTSIRGFNVVISGALGVLDHCQFLPSGNGIPIYLFHTNWNGADLGDGAWAAPTEWGSEHFFFIEDSTFTYPAGSAYAICDAYRGARYVVRYCTINRGWIEAHGTESGQRYRGTRAVEAYNNTYNTSGLGPGYLVNLRSGTALVHDNTILQSLNPVVHLTNHRNFWAFIPWGAADGKNPWDKNVPGGPFLSGNASAGGKLSVTVAGATWSPNQWRGYSIRKLSGNMQCSHYSEVTGNTTDTLTFLDSGGYGLSSNPPIPDLFFEAGDSFELNKVDVGLDQPGRSGGSLLRGDPPTVPSGWNDQVNDPVYVWNNVGAPNIVAAPSVLTIRAGEHYVNGSGPTGYVPFVHPHPLVSGQPLPQPLHPADANSDSALTSDEVTKFANCWKMAPNVLTGCPANATLDYAVRAGTLWKSSSTGLYRYDSTAPCPLCWMPAP